MVGVVAATALVAGLVGVGTAGASTPSSATKSVQAADSSVRAQHAIKPGTKCTKKQKGKTLKTKYGTLKCTKTGKKYVWKKVAAPAPRPPAPLAPPAPTPPTLPAPTPTPAACGTVGATGPGGGKVFYVDMSRAVGSQCFEAAPIGWSGGGDPQVAWGCEGMDIPGANPTGIGTGEANTVAIVTMCGTVGIAAWVADWSSNAGQTDWFLPSKDELNQLCKFARGQSTTVTDQAVFCNATGTLQFGFTAFDTYWSSSQADDVRAWYQYFGSGARSANNKNYRLSFMRPVRAF